MLALPAQTHSPNHFVHEADLSRFPSIAALEPSPKVSPRYGFIRTGEVVEGLKAHGFVPVSAQQARTRNPERVGYAKHLIRFRHQSLLEARAVGEYIPEVLLYNSHDGSGAYKVMAGIYRLVCANGLVVGDELAARSVRHSPRAAREVLEATLTVVGELDAVHDSIAVMRQTVLSSLERFLLARAALELRYSALHAAKYPLLPQTVLEPRRAEDTGHDVWSTFNVLQENLTRGGQRRLDGPRRTRRISGLAENLRLNRGLWDLAKAALKRNLEWR